MDVFRRDFLKLAGGGVAGAAATMQSSGAIADAGAFHRQSLTDKFDV